MVGYDFYILAFMGGSIPPADFPRLASRAQEQLARVKRLYYFETAANTPQSSSIGSVSSSQGTAVDISPKAQAKELYRCAALYLDIYRGCGRC